jgi:hypothetical protein
MDSIVAQDNICIPGSYICLRQDGYLICYSNRTEIILEQDVNDIPNFLQQGKFVGRDVSFI